MYHCHACGRKLLWAGHIAKYTTSTGLSYSAMLGPVCLEKERRAGKLPRPVADERKDAAPKRRRIAGAVPVTRRVRVLPGQLQLFPPAPA